MDKIIPKLDIKMYCGLCTYEVMKTLEQAEILYEVHNKGEYVQLQASKFIENSAYEITQFSIGSDFEVEIPKHLIGAIEIRITYDVEE